MFIIYICFDSNVIKVPFSRNVKVNSLDVRCGDLVNNYLLFSAHLTKVTFLLVQVNIKATHLNWCGTPRMTEFESCLGEDMLMGLHFD